MFLPVDDFECEYDNSSGPCTGLIYFDNYKNKMDNENEYLDSENGGSEDVVYGDNDPIDDYYDIPNDSVVDYVATNDSTICDPVVNNIDIYRDCFFNNENDKYICFHWTNLQPLNSIENRQKSDKLILHYYYNNIVNINRFNQIHTKYLGYQIVNESLQWLRIKLGYGKKPSYDDTEKVSETDNPQP
jgi:hypothetical protein